MIVTEWEAFRTLDFARLKMYVKVLTLVDLRNTYHARDIETPDFLIQVSGVQPWRT